jgi:ABC-2 type transport system permease protein
MSMDDVTRKRPFRWSVRRELWENHAIYIAPLIVAAVVIFGFMISTIGMPARRRALMALHPAKQQAAIVIPYDAAAMMLILTAFLVGVFYCLDALYGERRDRSILFWKSLPVSDLATVLSKAAIPMTVLPAVVFVVIIATQFFMLMWTTAVLMPSGLAGTTWSRFNIATQSVILLYGLIVTVLWHAPIYGWLLMVSAWARRGTFLWAILPFFALAILEKIAFNTSLVPFALKYRLMGGWEEGFAVPSNNTIHSLTQLTPGRFLAAAGLWLGLAFAAVFLGIATLLRRDRGPV